MKVVIALLLPSAILASILQPQKETYASYAKRNGIAIPETKTRSGASAQYADCWDYTGQQGYTRRINDYVANLGTDSNKFSSCCFYGIWLMYDDINYNQNNNNVSKNTVTQILTCTLYVKGLYVPITSFRPPLIVHGVKITVKTCHAPLTIRPVPSDLLEPPTDTSTIH